MYDLTWLRSGYASAMWLLDFSMPYDLLTTCIFTGVSSMRLCHDMRRLLKTIMLCWKLSQMILLDGTIWWVLIWFFQQTVLTIDHCISQSCPSRGSLIIADTPIEERVEEVSLEAPNVKVRKKLVLGKFAKEAEYELRIGPANSNLTGVVWMQSHAWLCNFLKKT